MEEIARLKKELEDLREWSETRDEVLLIMDHEVRQLYKSMTGVELSVNAAPVKAMKEAIEKMSNENNEEQCCANCYYRRLSKNTRLTGVVGPKVPTGNTDEVLRCHRNSPPTCTVLDSDSEYMKLVDDSRGSANEALMVIWPRTKLDGWCGEWRPKLS